MDRPLAGTAHDIEDQILTDHDRTAGDADHAASGRDQASNDRDQTASEEAERSSARDETAVERGEAAGARDATARSRDQAAHLRDEVADARDERARRLDGWSKSFLREKSNAVVRGEQAARDRAHAATDREGARHDREGAARDRDGATHDREGAAHDREGAAHDRGEAAHDREGAAHDRGEAAHDRELAAIDPLTGTRARGAGLAELQREIDRAQRSADVLVLAFVDVDGLKQVNDGEGHLAGDQLLATVASALRDGLRSYDLIMRFDLRRLRRAPRRRRRPRPHRTRRRRAPQTPVERNSRLRTRETKPQIQLFLARRAGLCGRRSAEHLANLAGDLEVFAGGDDEGSDAGLMACEVGVAGGGPVFVVVDG